MIEIVVVIAIVGMLVAMLIPAISGSRQSASRLMCENRMHQLGIAATSFADVHQEYPFAEYIHWLPFLEQNGLHDSLNKGRAQLSVSDLRHLGATTTVLQCPMDELMHPVLGQTNYLFNEGNALSVIGMGNGIGRATSPRSIQDGMSQTALMSERLVGGRWVNPPGQEPTAGDVAAHPQRFLWYIPEEHWPHDFDRGAFDAMCENQRTVAIPAIDYDNNLGWRVEYGYDHIRRPNSIGCYNGPPTTDSNIRFNRSLINSRPATSLHHGGVNLLLCDGSVRFVSDFVADDVWSALGSRAGGEVMSTSF